MGNPRHRLMVAVIASAAAIAATPGAAQKKYDPGASDTEIKVGNIIAYSGPFSAAAEAGKAFAAFFRKVNAEGGVNGRRINFISYDDAYSPPKTVEQARKLVESDEVLLIFSSVGTPTNAAIERYMNARKVPQLFIVSGAPRFNDPQHFPWTMGFQPSYQSESHVYAAYLLEHYPQGKIGILYQNDDFGRDYLKGLRDGLHGRIPVVAEASYESTDATVDSQIVNLKASGADILFDVAGPKFTAQAIKKTAEIGWKPVHLVNVASSSVGAVLKPAGFDNAKGLLTAGFLKEPTDPTWRNDPGYKEWSVFMDKYFPDNDRTSVYPAVQLSRGSGIGPGSQPVRRQSYPRERDEAGREPQTPSVRDAAAGDRDQHRPERLRPDQANANAALQRQRDL